MSSKKVKKPRTFEESGGAYGILGKPKDAYTEQELKDLGKELIAYMKEPRTIWYKGFCIRKEFSEDHLKYLTRTYPIFKEYVDIAREIQREKLITHPFWKEADGNFAKFILAKCHDEFKDEKPQDNTQNNTYYVNYANPKQVLPEDLSTTDSDSA